MISKLPVAHAHAKLPEKPRMAKPIDGPLNSEHQTPEPVIPNP